MDWLDRKSALKRVSPDYKTSYFERSNWDCCSDVELSIVVSDCWSLLSPSFLHVVKSLFDGLEDLSHSLCVDG